MSPAAPPVVLVQGDDPVLVGEAVRALVAEVLSGEDPSLAVEEYAGEDVDLAAVADACRTPPFLTARRVVILREVGAWSSDDLAPIVAYLDDPSPTTSLVLVSSGGRLAPKLTAAVKEKGRIVGTAVSGREARGWMGERIRASGLRLDRAATELMGDHLGEDVSRLGGVLDVLVAVYGEGAELGPDDVTPYLGQAGSVAPWDFTDAIDNGDTAGALSLLHRLLGAGERHPLVVLAIVARHVQSMLRVDSPTVATEAQAAAAMGIAKGRSTFPARKALSGARRMGSEGISEAIRLVAEAEVALKGKIDWPAELVLEVLVARLCRLSGRSRPAGATRPRGRPAGR